MNAWKKRNSFLHDYAEQDPALVDLWTTQDKQYMDPEAQGESWEKLTIQRINKLVENGSTSA